MFNKWKVEDGEIYEMLGFRNFLFVLTKHKLSHIARSSAEFTQLHNIQLCCDYNWFVNVTIGACELLNNLRF